MQFGVNQVYLAQVGLAWITRDPRTMLNRLTEVRVSLNSQSAQEPDALLIRLAKSVRRITAHCCHNSMHCLYLFQLTDYTRRSWG